MITVVVVGRNDNHGYNLTKRVAASLNSVAEMLNADDEIIFVDWNTPLGYPAMPISIQDDLLPTTRSLLRIIRVPESVHSQVSDGSKRALIEPIARNVGIRAAANESDWILSTNTDILFASPNSKKFSQVMRDLPETLWLSYRFEIPEFVWDEFDRKDPKTTAMKLIEWHKSGKFIKRIRVDSACGAHFPIPDGVGDFQLAPKWLWTKVTGFPEDMKKGWHVDTRLTLNMAKVSDVTPMLLPESELVIFHQNHLRNSTSYHSSNESNSTEIVNVPFQNPQSWGLSDFKFEEIDLQTSYTNTQKLIEGTSDLPTTVEFEENSISEISMRLDYNLLHTLNYLTDEISILPQYSIVHCFSGNPDTRFAIQKLCRIFNIVVEFPNLDAIRIEMLNNVPQGVNLVILDCGVSSEFPFFSPYVGGEINEKTKIAGHIVLNFENIAEIYSPVKPRLACIRAQNWATKELAHSQFFLPLFNNYTSVLVGTIREEPIGGYLQKLIYLGGIIADYGLNIQEVIRASSFKRQPFSIAAISLLYRLTKPLPPNVRKNLRNILKRTLFT
jgi:hypothetical protein